MEKQTKCHQTLCFSAHRRPIHILFAALFANVNKMLPCSLNNEQYKLGQDFKLDGVQQRVRHGAGHHLSWPPSRCLSAGAMCATAHKGCRWQRPRQRVRPR